MYLCIILSFFHDTGGFYGFRDNQIPRCNGGSPMYFENSHGRQRWRCNDHIIDHQTGSRCCNGSERSLRNGSFLEHRRLEVNKVMAILYGWALKLRHGSIANLAGCTRKSVTKTLKSWYQALQEDIVSIDCQVGGIDETAIRL